MLDLKTWIAHVDITKQQYNKISRINTVLLDWLKEQDQDIYNNNIFITWKDCLYHNLPDLLLKTDADIFEYIIQQARNITSNDMNQLNIQQITANVQKEIDTCPILSLHTNNNTFIQCRKCKSTDVIYESRQVRSADEGTTTFCICKQCGQKWTIH